MTPAIKKVTCVFTDKGRRETIELHSKEAAVNLLGKYSGLGLDFNEAMQAMKKYGQVIPIPNGFQIILSDESEIDTTPDEPEIEESDDN